MSFFRAGQDLWIRRLGNLRNVIRQEIIGRQLAPLVDHGMSVLDVGCGQGTLAIRLASAGCRVTGVDPSAEFLQICAEQASSENVAVELMLGGIEDIGDLLEGRRFDLVCCHGVMMYLEERAPALTNLAGCLAAEGRLSVTFRNAHALAMRPGLRHDWASALSAFTSNRYTNELGLATRADRIGDVETALDSAGLRLVSWAGVRVFNDATDPETVPPPAEELALLLDTEELAGTTDPYRWMASQLHVIAEPLPSV